MKLIGIYKIQSIVHPERCYVGSSVNINSRWNDHISDLRKNKHCNSKLQNHYNKYGLEDLEFLIILHGCKKEDLIFLEQSFINSYIPWFNICKIAGSQLGFKQSKKSINKRIKKLKGKHRTQESRNKMRISQLNLYINGFNSPNKNRKHSQEFKENCRQRMLGKPAIHPFKKGCISPRKGLKSSKETCDKISKSLMGKVSPKRGKTYSKK